MDPVVKKSISIIAAVFILVVMYIGSYLPYTKSSLYISTLQQISSVHSLSEFEARLSQPLDFWSPIGQEELVRNTANVAVNVVSGSTDASITKEVVRYITSYFQPILDYGKGMSFDQNLYILGALNEVAFQKTGDASYLQAAQGYFERGEQMSPNRPQFLYGLFDVYRFENNTAATKATGGKILSLWPDDQNVKAVLASLK